MLRVTSTPSCLRIFREGWDETLAVQNAEPDRRPYIHPLRAPDGKGELTEDRPGHHPWQHGLYIGLNDISGTGFWLEGLRGGTTDGTFHPKPLQAPTTSTDQVSWSVCTEYRHPSGSPLLTETQRWRLTDRGPTYTLDLTWELRAETDLVFGQYAYGGLFLRMPWRADAGAAALSSEGLRDQETEAQRARWVCVTMRLAGRDDVAGVAILDHPSNPEHPVPWRVDGSFGISPSRCIAGAWRLAQGASAIETYRVLAFTGKADAESIEAAYRDFAP